MDAASRFRWEECRGTREVLQGAVKGLADGR